MTLIDKINTVITNIQDANNLPVFRYGDLQEVEDGMNLLNYVLTLQENKFPIVYMNTDFEENEDAESGDVETDITMYLIGRSDIKYSAKDRHELELPSLRTIMESFINGLKRFGTFDTIKRKEIFLTKNQTEFESPVNIIKLTFTGLRYQLEC